MTEEEVRVCDECGSTAVCREVESPYDGSLWLCEATCAERAERAIELLEHERLQRGLSVNEFVYGVEGSPR